MIEWVQGFTGIAGLVVATSLFYVAKSSLENAKKERRQRYLEIKLKDVYSPLFQIFSLAKKGKETRRHEKREVAGTFVFIDDELPKIIKIYRYNSHYLNESLRETIREEIIDEPDFTKNRFTPNELDSAFTEISSTYYVLKSELEQLSA